MCFVTAGPRRSRSCFMTGRAIGCATPRLSTGRFQWWPRPEGVSVPLVARELLILLWNGHPDQAHMAEDWRRVA